MMLDFRLDTVCPHTESMEEVKQALPEFLFQKERERMSVFERHLLGIRRDWLWKPLKGLINQEGTWYKAHFWKDEVTHLKRGWYI